MIRLEKITEENYWECMKLKVAEEQTKFVTSNAVNLAKAYVAYETATPFAIYKDDVMVGVILMRFFEEIKQYAIWEFMIDEKYQSKGYGKEALKLAIEWAKADKEINAVILAYIEGNEGAKKFYTQMGFEQMGEPLDGEVDMILKL